MDPKNILDGADHICAAFESGKPFFIGRNGSSEMEAVAFWNTYRYTSFPRPSFRSWNPSLLKKLERGAGIWPATENSCDQWSKEYTDCLKLLDGVAAGWYQPMKNAEETLLTTYAPNAFRMPLRSLEPYYVEPEDRWTHFLIGKRVAVISSFSKTIQSQIQKGGIWSQQETILPPTTTWIPIQTYYSPEVSMGDSTSWPTGISSWTQSAQMIVDKVVDSGASVAIIGCGGLGMIIGGRLKQLGISSIIMGGAIQVLFGIKGFRWETHTIISKFWNNAWVWPDTTETPSGALKIEGGCYWGNSMKTFSAPSTTPR